MHSIEQKFGDAIVRTLADTIALEAATLPFHATHFAKVATKEEENKHEELKQNHVALNASHNVLHIANIILKKELATRDSTALSNENFENIQRIEAEVQKKKRER